MTLTSIHPTGIAAHAGSGFVQKKEIMAEMNSNPDAVTVDEVHRLRCQSGGEEGHRPGLRVCLHGTRRD
jgi:hypothetical protein